MNRFVATTGNGQVEVHQSAIPEPGPNEVLVKVAYAALAPFDLYQVDAGFYVQQPHTAISIDAAGVVAKVGSSVSDLKEGDRVTVFPCRSPNGKGLQEYTVLARTLVAKIPDSLSLEEASTLSGNVITAFHSLFDRLGLPWSIDFPKLDSSTQQNLDEPILIYGAGSSSGQYMIQLLGLAGYTKVVAVASSRHNELLRGMGAAHVVDYRSTSFVEDITKAVGGERKIRSVVDCVALDESLAAIAKVVSPGAKYFFLAPMKRGGDITGKGSSFETEIPEQVSKAFPSDVQFFPVFTFQFDKNERVANAFMPTILPRLLEQGLIKPNATTTFQTGTLLERVNAGLQVLRQNGGNGRKVVIKVEDS